MATERQADQKPAVPFAAYRLEWGYVLGWLLVCLATGYGTYRLIADNPAVAPADRQPTNGEDAVGKAYQATAIRLTEVDPATNEVMWELRVPESAGGITSETTFEDPVIELFPKGHAFTIEASRAVIAAAPATQIHTGDNVQLELAGPIRGTSADGRESFTAERAVWEGATHQLTLHGNPLTLTRGTMVVTGTLLEATFHPDGRTDYRLSGGVRLEG